MFVAPIDGSFSIEPPLDMNGPISRPFIQFEDSWLDQPIFSRFEAVASANVRRLAIQDQHTQLSYGEVLEASRRLARRIASVPAQSGAIGLLLPNCALYPVAVLACLAAGRMYVALDLRYPAARNTHLIGTAKLDALLTLEDPEAYGVQIPTGLPCINLADILHAGVDAASTINPPRSSAPDDPALVLYTSGSSGLPKGVVNSQRSLLQRVQQHINASHISVTDRVCPLSSPSTISGMREQMTALLAGATLQVVDPLRVGLRAIRYVMRSSEVTIVYAVPALLRTIVHAGDDTDDFASIRIMRIGGDRVLWSDLAMVRPVLAPSCHIQIGFSSSEVPGTQWFVPLGVSQDGPAVPIGFCLPGLTLTVVDDEGQAVALGQYGELVIHGRSVALGHWRDGGIVPGPFRPWRGNPAERSFATGDSVRQRTDGLYEAAGRKDRQVKIRGQRVEPAELESLLQLSPEVSDAAVICPAQPARAGLVAFVVPRPNGKPALPDRLMAIATASLPSALRPLAIHVVAEIPHLPSAKPDLAALADLHQRLNSREVNGALANRAGSPQTLNVNKLVRQVWRKLLGRRALAGDPTWIEAGGDSLTLLQFVFLIERALRFDLPVEMFDAEMRVDGFVAAIEEAAQGPDQDEVEDDRPLVCLMPGVDGDEPLLALFRRDLKARIRFLVVQYPTSDQMLRTPTFDAVIDDVCQQILACAPSGSIRLAGYSYGGLVAFAAAQRLGAMGRDIAFLGLLDTELKKGSADRLPVGLGLRQREWIHLKLAWLRENTRNFGLADTVCYLTANAVVWHPALPLARCIARSKKFLLTRHLRITLRLNGAREWVRRLPQQACRVPMVLFRSAAHPATAALDLGWGRIAQVLQVVHVEGNHHSMLEGAHRGRLVRTFESVTLQLPTKPPGCE